MMSNLGAQWKISTDRLIVNVRGGTTSTNMGIVRIIIHQSISYMNIYIYILFFYIVQYRLRALKKKTSYFPIIVTCQIFFLVTSQTEKGSPYFPLKSTGWSKCWRSAHFPPNVATSIQGSTMEPEALTGKNRKGVKTKAPQKYLQTNEGDLTKKSLTDPRRKHM